MEAADQRGYGFTRKLIVNVKTAYPKEAVLEWLAGKIKTTPADDGPKRRSKPHKNDILLGK
jgi:hypothetical protein